MMLYACAAVLFNVLLSPFKGKVSALAGPKGISPLLTTIIIVAVIAVGAVVIYLVVVSGGGLSTTTYP
jgi:hypothetical protein